MENIKLPAYPQQTYQEALANTSVHLAKSVLEKANQ